jgi:hypothetical protein
VLPVGIVLERHLVGNPGEADVGLGPTQFLERGDTIVINAT